MDRLKKIIISIIAFAVGITPVLAECNTSELNQLRSEAFQVKVDYEVVKEYIEMDENINTPDGMTEEEQENYRPTRNYFQINISNLTSNLYIVVTDNSTKESQTFNYSDSNNDIVSFKEPVFVMTTNYTIKVYSSNNTSCPNTELYTTYLTTPMYNNYSESYLCKGIEEFYMCHEYLDIDISFENFNTLTENYREGKINPNGEEISNSEEQTTGNTFIEYIAEHKIVVVLIVIILILTGTTITVVIIKKQRSKDNETI